MLARFPSADTLTEAVTDLRQQGYRKLDAFSPFPIHGLSKKLGLGRSPLPPVVFVAGALGLLLSLGGILYLNVIEYPLITGGKPYAAVQPITPILFEVMILFAALATVGGLLKLTGLPFFGHPLLKVERFPQSDLRWLLSVRRRPRRAIRRVRNEAGSRRFGWAATSAGGGLNHETSPPGIYRTAERWYRSCSGCAAGSSRIGR